MSHQSTPSAGPGGPHATLHLMCGKIAAGKSTLAARLAASDAAIVLSEDDWLSALYADQMATPADYLRCTGLLRKAMGPHVVTLLRAGMSVVLDFAANTVAQRVWMRGLIDAAGAKHVMHVLETPDEVCLARLRARNAAGDHPFAATEAQFHLFARHFVPPGPDEGFVIRRHVID